MRVFHRNIRYSWVSLGYFAVNLSGGQPKCIDDCAVLE